MHHKAGAVLPVGGGGHFAAVPQKAKAGDVGGALHTGQPSCLRGRPVQPQHRVDGSVEMAEVKVRFALPCAVPCRSAAALAAARDLGGRRDDTGAQRLGQKEGVARLRTALAHDLGRDG